MPRSNRCWPKSKGRTRCGDDHWGVKDGDVSNLEVLSSYCLFFFVGGNEKSVPIFFDSLFLDASQKGCSCSFFGLQVTVRRCTASSLFLVAVASTIFPFFEHPC